MNERYLFRGERLEQNAKGQHAWHVGYLYLDEEFGNYRIISGDRDYAIAPSSIGQCTGLRDKNGRLIFEGDIIQAAYLQEAFAVEWRESAWMLSDKVSIFLHNMDLSKVEIIGNIHDNPELLEGGQQ